MSKRFDFLSTFLNPPKTVLYLTAMFFLGVIYLAVFRLIFLLRHKTLTADIPLGTIFQSFLIGARFDMVLLSYIFIPLFLLSYLPFIGIHRLKLSRVIIQALLFFVMALVFLLSLIDVEYFTEFGTRTSFWALEYLDQTGMVWYSIWSGYPVTPYLLLWAVTVFSFIWLGIRIQKRIFGESERIPIPKYVFYFLVVGFLLFTGARGRLKLAPINWGLAYFSQYDFANQLSLNGVYTLGRSIYEKHKESRNESRRHFHFFSREKTLSTVQGMLLTSQDSLTAPSNSIQRFYRPISGEENPRKYNVVIILLESWLADFIGAYGDTSHITPHFDSLAAKGILFENFFATGTRTNRGLVSILCSFPSQPIRSVMKKFYFDYPFTSLSTLLKDLGYESVFLYGGDLQFDNMEGFLRSQGFERFIGEGDFPSKQSLGKWGVPDHTVFERANQEFSQTKDRPFLGVIMTLSNHEPFLLPDKTFEIFPPDRPNHEYLNAFYYSDWALGEFFRQAEKESYFKNTIFVLVADHGKLIGNSADLPWDRFHIACLIYAPEIIGTKPRRIPMVASQTDLTPIICGLLRFPALHQFWGRDILSLSPEDTGFALIVEGHRVGWIEKPYFFIDRIRAKHSLFNFREDPLQRIDLSSQFPELVEKFQTRARCFLQLSLEIFQDVEKATKTP